MAPVAASAAVPAADRYPTVINGHAPTLHPEGVAYDPARKAFLVSSMRQGTVSILRPDGSVKTLVRDSKLISAVGIQIDSAHQRLFVANADDGAGEHSSPETQKHVAGLGVYDLRTGHRVRYVDLAATTGGVRENHFGNDIALAPDGTAYVTDSFAPVIYRVDTDGRASVFLRDARLGGSDFAANGIAWQDGHLIIAKTNDGTLWRVPAQRPRSLRRVPLDRPLTGADGIALRRDGSLLVVRNRLSATPANAVAVVRPAKDWKSARVTSQRFWKDPAPTTAAADPRGRFYVLSGRMDLLFVGKPVDTFTLRRF
ncbi:SMP-30/gluconolactonase/LRE family protein [Nonomuraea sp. K274]|uniref:SMP-30/gluconolactonase/LRE family protein n=2 Tax=Nonomuraea cypriaca TaxID=1187855 RepID=A0A931A5C8_9ACTN|nr:SMP-30/gluconolactonase/LRE family protein [Nonomuraea cypriaca]